jgi:hypothetical protein
MELRMRFRKIVSANIATIAAILLSACATTSDGPLRDSYGLMSVELPWGWKDATAAFGAQSSAAQSFGRLRNDTGIRYLLYVKRHDYGDCKFRELTYMPGEAAYAWSLEKLNYEVAQVRNSFMNSSTAEFVRLGVMPQVSNTKANSTELTLSSATTFTRFQGWQHRYRHEFNGDRGGKVRTDTWTLSMRFASKGTRAKRYLIAECSLDGSDRRYQETVTAVEKLLASVDFDGDFRFVPPPGPGIGTLKN